MNNSQQAKNGFKTFILALIVSLGVFATFYYITSYPADKVDIETHSDASKEDEKVISYNGELGTGGETFKKLASEKVSVPVRAVLSGSDESTQSTTSVPDTGVASITTALVIALGTLLLGGYLIYLNPRKFALSKFEKEF